MPTAVRLALLGRPVARDAAPGGCGGFVLGRAATPRQRHRRGRLAQAVVLALVAAGLVAGCAAGSTPAPSTPSADLSSPAVTSAGPGVPPLQPTSPAPTGAPAGQALPTKVNYGDPVDVAAHYVAATCSFDWRQPYGTRERRSAAYLTPRAARAGGPSAAGRTDWTRNVVRNRLVGSCRIVAAQVLDEAPNTATTRYVNVVAARAISQQGRPAQHDQAEYTYVLLRAGRRWLVDHASAGG